jgi:glycosyltransferase involved in cell wall biosynthesis
MKDPKSILMVTPQLNGGITQVVNILLKGGLQYDDRIQIFYSTFEGAGVVKYCRIARQIVLFALKILVDRPCICHIHLSSHGSFYRKVPYIYLCDWLHIDTIIHVHPTHFLDFLSSLSPVKRKFAVHVLKKADRFIVLTESVSSALGELLPGIPINVIPNPIFLEQYQYDPNTKREDCNLIFLSSILKTKGVYELLEAAIKVKQQLPEFQLSFYGNRDTDKLRQKVVERGVQDYVRVFDWVETEEKIRLLKKATALILPTYTEGIPNILLECLALGTPVLTTPVGGIPTIIENDVNGMFFPPREISPMVIRIVELLTSTAKQEALREAGLHSVQRYDAHKVVDQLQSVYAEMV